MRPPQYRRDIDGLRAIAVLSVLTFHAFPEIVHGGFVGVDIFFVISGFLITRIILNDVARGNFSFRDFYAHRIRRIFPALAVVLISCLVLGWFLLLPKDYAELGKHVLAGAGFVSNLVLWGESGYFDKAAELKPLLHLWSLGIEEQFYIIWPLILFLGWKRQLNLLVLTAVLGASSFLLNLQWMAGDPVADFYSPVSRIWELLIGSVLAYITRERPASVAATRPSTLRSAQSLVGIFLIISAVLFLNARVQFPGWWALVPVSGAYMLISAGPQALVNRTVLSRPLLVFIGLISYPLYLWHWPLLVFARIVNSGTPTASIRLSMVALSVILAYLTYRFIEKPIRFALAPSKSVPGLSAAMAMVALGGFGCLLLNGMPWRLSDEIQSYLTYQYDFKSDARVGTCWLNNSALPDGYSDACVDPGQAGKPLAVVWVDSHAARFFPGVKAMTSNQFRLAQFTRDSCPPVLNYGYGVCSHANDYIVKKIKALQPETVILFAVWNHYALNDGNDSIYEKLVATIDTLKADGVRNIVVVGPAPQWHSPLPDNIASQFIKTDTKTIPDRTYSNFNFEVRKSDAILKDQIQTIPGARYFSALDALCDTSGCLTTVNGRADGLTSWDYGHLTTPGANYLAQKLVDSTDHFSKDTD